MKAFKRRKQVNRQNAEQIITEYLKPIFGFTLKRCKNVQDAEDLAQDIVLKAFRALTVRDDIEDPGKFIWTVAHNALSNYYRDTAKSVIGRSIDEVAEIIADPNSAFDSIIDADTADTIRRLQSEIAYLSKLQRKIVIAYYFEDRRQADIADALNIPLGTVKWHLFEAKKELKRGMDTMRKTGELKFNPIKFSFCGINGSVGTISPNDFFRSALSQNICYCVRNTAKSINEIADEIGVSPVYVESEVEFLEEYGFLQVKKDKYIVNFIINEPTSELIAMQDDMYKHAAEIFANDLYDELVSSGILDDENILCSQTDSPISLTESPRADHNFILWSLIPYIVAASGDSLKDNKISFEEVATIRPDGAKNIFTAHVFNDKISFPESYLHMNDWCGPVWDGNGKHILWRIYSKWSDRLDQQGFMRYSEDAERILSLYEREFDELLSKDEYAWLAERGYVKTNGDYEGQFKSSWQIVILENKEIQNKLINIGDKIKKKYRDEFDKFKAPYVEAVLASVPSHLRKIKEFELQSVFHTDGSFILHCIIALLKNGKLKEPAEKQKKSLITLIINA